MLTLRALLGDYPNTRALKSGAVRSPRLELAFADVKVPNTAFKDVVRGGRYDVGELAIVTYLQAKAWGRPLALIPAVVMAVAPHPFLVGAAGREPLAPSALTGRRVGIRAYSVTTVAWIRGILQHDHGVDPDRVRWVTFEDPHVPEYRDPETATRAPAGKKLLDMLFGGELDAAVVSARELGDPRLASLIPDPATAARKWSEKTGAAPLNHMVVIPDSLCRENAWAAGEIYRLLMDSARAAGDDAVTGRFGVNAVRRSLEVIIGYCVEQRLIPRRFAVDELFDDVTGALGP